MIGTLQTTIGTLQTTIGTLQTETGAYIPYNATEALQTVTGTLKNA